MRQAVALFFLLAGFLAPALLRAGVNEWTPVGPEGGVVNALVVDPATPSVVYAATSGGGVFKSVDRGASWRAVNAGLTSNPSYGSTAIGVFALAVDPIHPSTLYAAVDAYGIFKTVNGGATWAPILTAFGGEFDPHVTALAVDPATPSNVFAASSRHGVLLSRDAGAMWTAGPRIGGAAALATDRRIRGTVYVGGADGVFKTTDAGATWSQASAGPSRVQALAIDPSYSAVIYAGTFGAGLFRSADAGRTWARAGSGMPTSPIAVVTIDPSSTATVYAGTFMGLYKSSDAGSTWTLAPGLQGFVIYDLAVNPADPRNLYAGTAGSGVFQSADAGLTWRTANAGLSSVPILSLAVDPRTPSTIYAGSATARGRLLVFAGQTQPLFLGAPGGVWRSLDAGSNWTFSPVALNFEARAIVIDRGDPMVLYTGGYGVFRSTDGGLTWTQASSGLTQTNVRALAADPSNPGRLYAGTQVRFGGGLFKSTDGGQNWIGPRLGVAVESISVDPRVPSTVYVGSDFYGAFKSVDAGATWVSSSAGIDYPGNIRAIAIDPSNPATLYATGLYATGVFKSTDGAAHWTRAAQGLETYGGPFTIDPLFPLTVYAAGSGAVSRTTDGAQNWSALSRGLDGRRVTALAIDPADRKTLYAAVEGRGLFRYTIAGNPSQCVSSTRKLCLHGERFQVRVAFHSPDGRLGGDAQAVPIASDTGVFWFFSGNNLELTVKVVDGRAVNGNFWVFFGGLSDVAYTVTVKDAQTGATKTYENPQGRLASVADTSAFQSLDDSSATPEPPAGFTPAAEGPSPCGSGPAALCLNDSRFRVEASWRIPSGASGAGAAVPLASDTGAFWFFTPNNIELAVKVVDGRAFNNKYWVFYGALSDVEYTITVTDTVTGNVKTYFNSSGQMGSVADTAAF